MSKEVIEADCFGSEVNLVSALVVNSFKLVTFHNTLPGSTYHAGQRSVANQETSPQQQPREKWSLCWHPRGRLGQR